MAWTTRELLISSVAGVRGAITLAGVLSIPLLLPDGNVFPARYELIFLAAGVILFSLFVGVIALPILLRHIESSDNVQQRKEERLARAATADVAIVAIQKMEERLAADTKENIDTQLLTEVSSRVIGNLRRRADGRNDVETSMLEESLERRFRRRRCALSAASCIICAPPGRSVTRRCRSCSTISTCWKRC